MCVSIGGICNRVYIFMFRASVIQAKSISQHMLLKKIEVKVVLHGAEL